MIVINLHVHGGVPAQVKRAVGLEQEQNPGQSIILLSAFSVNQQRKPSMNLERVTRLFGFSDYPDRSLTPALHQVHTFHLRFLYSFCQLQPFFLPLACLEIIQFQFPLTTILVFLFRPLQAGSRISPAVQCAGDDPSSLNRVEVDRTNLRRRPPGIPLFRRNLLQ